LLVSRISFLVASMSKASKAWACRRPGPCRLPFSLTEAMMFRHLETVRDAMWISPKSMLFCAHLCATTCATPPAPTIRTLRFIGQTSSLQSREILSGQAADVIAIGKLAYLAYAAIELLDGNGRHVDAVEPVLLHHGVATGV